MSSFLVDTSVWHRYSNRSVREKLVALTASGSVSTCKLITLELLYSARSSEEYVKRSADFLGFDQIPITPEILDRAVHIQSQLVEKSQHRGPGAADLIIAACADVSGATVLHYDHHFEVIGKLAGVSQQWVVAADSID